MMPDYYSDIFGGGYGYYGGLGNIASAAGPILIVSAVLALLLAIFFLPKRNQGKFSPVLNKLYNFMNFNVYWLTYIIKFLYAALSIYLFIMGIYTMFAVNFWAGIMLILSIFVVRVIFESLYAMFSIRNNVEDINRKMGTGSGGSPYIPTAPQNGGGYTASAPREPQRQGQQSQAAPTYAPPAPEPEPEPDPNKCTNCGATIREGAMFCANCGAKVK